MKRTHIDVLLWFAIINGCFAAWIVSPWFWLPTAGLVLAVARREGY